MWPWHRLTDGGQPLDPKTIGQQSNAVLIFKRKHYHRIVSNIWPSLWSKQKEICKLSSSRKNRQVKIQKILTKMTSNKLNGRADQEKTDSLKKKGAKKCSEGILFRISTRLQGHRVVGCQVCFLIEKWKLCVEMLSLWKSKFPLLFIFKLNETQLDAIWLWALQRQISATAHRILCAGSWWS